MLSRNPQGPLGFPPWPQIMEIFQKCWSYPSIQIFVPILLPGRWQRPWFVSAPLNRCRWVHSLRAGGRRAPGGAPFDLEWPSGVGPQPRPNCTRNYQAAPANRNVPTLDFLFTSSEWLVHTFSYSLLFVFKFSKAFTKIINVNCDGMSKKVKVYDVTTIIDHVSMNMSSYDFLTWAYGSSVSPCVQSKMENRKYWKNKI